MRRSRPNTSVQHTWCRESSQCACCRSVMRVLRSCSGRGGPAGPALGGAGPCGTSAGRAVGGWDRCVVGAISPGQATWCSSRALGSRGGRGHRRLGWEGPVVAAWGQHRRKEGRGGAGRGGSPVGSVMSGSDAAHREIPASGHAADRQLAAVNASHPWWGWLRGASLSAIAWTYTLYFLTAGHQARVSLSL